MKHNLTLSAIFVVFCLAGTSSIETGNNTRIGKLLSIFQVVSFPNDPCIGSSTRNGTCFTSDECSSRGGTSSGTCAQGFGICCIFTRSCGDTITQNCTYLVQDATTNPVSNPCIFTICKESSNICRIRLDFTTFSIAGPVAGTVLNTGALPEDTGVFIGDCTTDTFVVTSPGNQPSPIICGFNSGQHMIIDAAEACNKATFAFGGTGTTRQYDIKVTQYVCGDERGGPDGCLQYFTGNTGKFASFNFPTTSATVAEAVTHLSSQCYTMCFRQEVGQCAICFNAVTKGTSAMVNDQGSFGLSVSTASTEKKGVQDSGCTSDYLQIPGSEHDGALAAEMFAVGSIAALGHDRICGRFFGYSSEAGLAGAENNEASICTQQRPFRVIFKTDANEATTGNANTNEDTTELAEPPGGIIGFHLNYALQDC